MMQNVVTPSEISRRLRVLGDDISSDSLTIPAQLYVPLHETEPYAGVRVTRDLPYGGHPKQRLTIFEADSGPANAKPVFVFVHGGGYAHGDRRLEEWPVYYDNIGLWAARHGMIGVAMSYRLAPDFVWPSGGDDVNAAVTWLQTNIAGYHGSPDRIVLAGHSAGATHIGDYIRHATHPVAALVLMSGGYDIPQMGPYTQNHLAYYGRDEAIYASRSSFDAIAAAAVPVFVSFAEYDAPKFQIQARTLLKSLSEHRSRSVPSICLPGQTHFSQVFHINAAGIPSCLTETLLAFIGNIMEEVTA